MRVDPDYATLYGMSQACPVCSHTGEQSRRGLCPICDAVLLEVARHAGFPVDTVHGRRFMSHATMAGPIPTHAPEMGPCWLWTGALTSEGYGLFRVDAEHLASVHVLAYQWAHGPVPDGMEVDHLCCAPEGCPGGKCIHRSCFNPEHVQARTHLENILRGSGPTAINARKTHCDRGHPLFGENLYTHPRRGTRHCRACQARRVVEASARAAAATLAVAKVRTLQGQVRRQVPTRGEQGASSSAAP